MRAQTGVVSIQGSQMGADASAVERLLRQRARDWTDRLADGVVRGAQQRTSRRTGALHDSIAATPAADSGDTFVAHVRVGADYGKFQDEGTGVYAPGGTRIQGNPLLAFDWPAAGGLVIVHSVAGSPGTHFWSETMGDWPNIVRAAT